MKLRAKAEMTYKRDGSPHGCIVLIDFVFSGGVMEARFHGHQWKSFPYRPEDRGFWLSDFEIRNAVLETMPGVLKRAEHVCDDD